MNKKSKNRNSRLSQTKRVGQSSSQKVKTKKKGRVGLTIFFIIMLAIGITAGVFAGKVQENGGGVQGIIKTFLNPNEEKLDKLDTFYCLLMGHSQGLTDTIMLFGYDPAQQKASLLSIPRDTFVGKSKSSATTYDKINSLYHSILPVSPERTVQAVEKITGLEINKYILIDTKALRKAVDLVGGIYFDVPINMYYTDESQNLYINLKKGYQLLDGNKAEQVVRFRHNNDWTSYPESYGGEDIGRTKTQRAFLTELVKQTIKVENIFKIGEYLNIFYEDVITNVEMSEMLDYISYAVDFDIEKLQSGMLPGEPEYCNGLSFFLHNQEETDEMIDELFGNLDVPDDGARVEIVNGTGNKEINSILKAKLRKRGYNVISVSNTTSTSKTSIINRNEKDEESEKIVAFLGVGIITKTEKNEDSKADITIVLGEDYKNE